MNAAPRDLNPRRRRQRNTSDGTPTDRTAAKMFNMEIFERMTKDLVSGRTAKSKLTVAYDGLQVIMRDTGMISFNALYEVNGERKSFVLGEYPEMTLAEAQSLTNTIRILGDKGVDVQDYRARLIRELKKEGVSWKP
jgi:hypothetical protein